VNFKLLNQQIFSNLKELFLLIAPWINIIFLAAIPPEIFRNFKNKTYASGTLIAWVMKIIGCICFGMYSWMIHEYITAFIQAISIILCSAVIVQYIKYPEKFP